MHTYRNQKRTNLKCLLVLFFILINIYANSQILNLDDPGFKGNIYSVIEKSKRYSQDRREFSFDSLSRLKEKKSYRDNKLVQEVKWTYLNLDSVLISKEQIADNIYIHKSTFDSNMRLKKYELFSTLDSVFPMITEANIHYLNGFIQQFNRILINQRDTTVNELYKFEYYQDNTRIVIKKSDNKNISSETITLRFDPKGNLISKIIDNNNPLAAIAGVRTWSKSRPDKYQINYKYDNYGNWINSYSLTQFCRYKISTRKIIYK